MPVLLAACPTAGTLPNTGAGGLMGVLWVALVGLIAAALVLRLRAGHGARATTALLAAALLGLPMATGAMAATSDCAVQHPAVANSGFQATTFKQAGAEPNVAISPSGKNILVSGLGGRQGAPAALFRSTDYGKTFSPINPTFANVGAGDWDMRWLDDTHVIAADLALPNGVYIHRSADAGDHWTDSVVQKDVYDRPWIDHNGADKVYLATKGFDGIPYLFSSTDGGATFSTLPLIVYGIPTTGGPDTPAAFVLGQNTYVDHLLASKSGDVYVLYGAQPGSTYSPGQPEGVPNQLYVAHLENGAMFSRPVHLGGSDESCLGGFNWLTEDQAGILYVLGNCRINGRWSTWLSYSKDKSHTWSPLKDLGEPGASNVYGSIAGADAGKLSLVYLRGSNTDPATAQDWFARMATVTGADTATPSVATATAIAGSIHTKDICFDGILCSTVPPFGQNRSLLDYIWNAVAPDGSAYGVFASDGPATGSADGQNPDVVVVHQTGGPSLGRGVPS
jgi:hypothetical protein